VVDRSAIVKGYEFQKDQYVRFTDEEIKSLEPRPGREPWRRFPLRPDEYLVLGNDLEDEADVVEDDVTGLDDALAVAALRTRAMRPIRPR
jgi:hypothetical protein